MSTSGRFTIPSESNFAEKTAELARLWGADAVRNSDGTQLDDEVVALGMKVYTAYFPTRAHNEWITLHMDETPQVYLLSKRALAESDTGDVSLMDGSSRSSSSRTSTPTRTSTGKSWTVRRAPWCRPSSGPWTPKRA